MSHEVVRLERVAHRIVRIRQQNVLLSQHLAELYSVFVKALNQAVKRHAERFPPDFMFQLTAEEFDNLKSQLVTSSWGGARRALPYAFTEQGVAMLSSVLRSDRAVKVNIEIMRAFVRLRQTLNANDALARKFSELEKRVGKHDQDITAIIDAIRQLMAPPEKAKREIGFHVREKAATYRARKKR